MAGFAKQLYYYLVDIKLLHTLFTLPFVIVTFAITDPAKLSIIPMALILLAFLFARSYAMGMNRLLDRHIDASNPRTQRRMLPSQKLRVLSSKQLVLSSGCLFVLISTLIHGWLVIPACLLLGLFTGYSYFKRIHWLVHFYLGLCLGLLPFAITIALSSPITPSVTLLGVAIFAWVSGFDVLYALSDQNFDRQAKLHSLPAVHGTPTTLRVSGACFIAMIICLGLVGLKEQAGYVYGAGLGIIGLLLAWTWLRAKQGQPGKVLGYNAWVGVIYAMFFLMGKGL